MPRLHLLGTGAALSSPDRTTTMLAVQGESTLVIDCGGDVVQRLLASGVDDIGSIEFLLLTHGHPDHVCGFPLFMQKIWLARRKRPVPVLGPAPALEQARRVFEAFDTSRWAGMPEILWREIPLEENVEVWRSEEWRIVTSPGRHGVPVVGVRIEASDGGCVVYSSDTEACEPIARLARDADVLVHEATGNFTGHATAAAAAELARSAGVDSLILVHLPPIPDEQDLEQAAAIFPALELGADGTVRDF